MNLDDAIRGLAEELGRLLEDRFICFRKPIGLEELQVILHRNLRPWFDDYEKRSAEVFAGMLASGDSALAAKDKRIAELEGMYRKEWLIGLVARDAVKKWIAADDRTVRAITGMCALRDAIGVEEEAVPCPADDSQPSE